MKIQIDELEFNIIVNEQLLSGTKTPVVFLHGFTGCARDWLFILNKLPSNFLPIAIDLIGHGKSSSPSNLNLYSPNSIADQLNKIFDYLSFEKIILSGYSMGGRAALTYSLKYPQRIKGLVLESSTVGLENKHQKDERIANDFKLAEKIEKEGIQRFIEYWMNIPLFESLKKLPDAKYRSIIESRMNNSITGLANSLRGFGTGKMEIDSTFLCDIEIPILLITGELDNKFTELNKNLIGKFKEATHKVIKNVGHNTHSENQEEYISIINNFLNNFY